MSCSDYSSTYTWSSVHGNGFRFQWNFPPSNDKSLISGRRRPLAQETPSAGNPSCLLLPQAGKPAPLCVAPKPWAHLSYHSTVSLASLVSAFSDGMIHL